MHNYISPAYIHTYIHGAQNNTSRFRYLEVSVRDKFYLLQQSQKHVVLYSPSSEYVDQHFANAGNICNILMFSFQRAKLHFDGCYRC